MPVSRIYIIDDKMYFVDVETGATKLLDIVIPKTDTISEKTAGAGVTIDGILIKDSLSVSGIIPISGWIAADETWTYFSIDVKTGVINVNADVTGKYSPGMRIKYTQNATVKYGIITAIGAFSGGVTPITFWGGTDYTLADAAITSPFYSVVKAPFGFPLNPTKWEVVKIDTTERSQATPTQNVWYNLGSVSLAIPIGIWKVSYMVSISNLTVSKSVSVTLSDANNTELSVNYTVGTFTTAGGEHFPLTKIIDLNVATKTTYYLNTRSIDATSGTIYNLNSRTTLVISAISAYL